MRGVDSWLDRFAYKHPRLGIPRLMLYVVIGNLIVFFLDLFSASTFSPMLVFSGHLILRGQVWRLITFVFVPLYSGMRYIFFFALSLYFYYFIGTMLEREWGSTKFTLFYSMGVALNILVGFVIYFIYLALGLPLAPYLVTANMHYVNLSLFFAFATLYPEMRFLFIIIPVKVKWLAWLDAALFVLDMVEMAVDGSFFLLPLPVVAILNYFLFFYSPIKETLSRGRRVAKHQQSQAAVNFRAAQRKAKETKGYMHKCAVCGRTDTDNPGLEFRYCSKCDGYHCYCMDHINDHVHVKN